jgi:hypothetical protein
MGVMPTKQRRPPGGEGRPQGEEDQLQGEDHGLEGEGLGRRVDEALLSRSCSCNPAWNSYC